MRAGRCWQRRVGRCAILVLAVTLGGGCASAGRSARSGPIDADELQAVGAVSIYDAVRLLRPSWLSNLSGAYRGDLRLTIDDLRDLSASDAGRVELLSSEEATARWGTRTLSGRFLSVTPRVEVPR